MKVADAIPDEALTFWQTSGSRKGRCKCFQAKFAAAWVLLGPGKGNVGAPK